MTKTAIHLSEVFDADYLEQMIREGYVSFQTHPTLPLFIYNYSPAAQYERAWNTVTTQCRGLIVDSGSGRVVARPFPKFFNYEEVIEDSSARLPDGDPIISEKMDGSLGIIYTYGGQTAVATRGSFASDQAVWATNWLHENYPYFVQPDGVTTLVEIIYPDNRIVVDYCGEEGLWLLGAIDNDTGADIPFDLITWWPGERARQYEWNLEAAIEAAKSSRFDVEEGVVITWLRDSAPSVRLKVKNPRYVELHRIITGLSTRTVHEALANDTFEDLVSAVPDEFYPWVEGVASDLRAQYQKIYWQARNDLIAARRWADSLADRAFRDFDTDPAYSRKDLATHITQHAAYPGLCFAMEDDKNMPEKIWPLLVPERKTAVIIDDK